MRIELKCVIVIFYSVYMSPYVGHDESLVHDE